MGPLLEDMVTPGFRADIPNEDEPMAGTYSEGTRTQQVSDGFQKLTGLEGALERGKHEHVEDPPAVRQTV